MPKIIQSGGFLGTLLGKCTGPSMGVAVPLAKNILAPITTMKSSSAIDGAIQKNFTDKDEIIRVMKSPENLGVLIDRVNETVKNEIKEEGGFLGMLLQL